MTAAKFSRMILNLSEELNVSVMDAIIHYCEKNSVEIETAAKLCNKKVKDQLYDEAQGHKLVK